MTYPAEFKVREGEYVPSTGLEYSSTDHLARMVPQVKVKDIRFDSSYPFLDERFAFKAQRTLAYLIIDTYLYLLNRLKFGLRIEGRERLKACRDLLAGGAVSVSNHCYRYDGIAVHYALRHRLWIPMLPDLLTGKDAWPLRHFGGIPLPENELGAQKRFSSAFDRIHERGGWIHVFAEARSWPYYKPVRPFQKGAFTFAYKYDVPVIPLSISYRERKGIHRLFAPREIPLITVRVGDPIVPDTAAPRKDEVDRLLTTCHAAVCALGGIEVNPWPAKAE